MKRKHSHLIRNASLVCALTICLPAAFAGPPQYTITDLGTLGGFGSDAYSINASGQVVGLADANGGADWLIAARR